MPSWTETLPTTMTAVLFDEPADDARATRVGPVSLPRPGAGEVLIRVSHAGVNFKDVMSRRGDAGYVDAWPFTPGLEASGTVVEVGPDVVRPTVGEVVSALTNRGALAEFVVARADLTASVPSGLDLAQAAAAPGALTTAQLLVEHYARVRDHDVVLVHSAAGAVGTAIAAAVRRYSDVALIGTVGSASREAAALASGYDHVLVRGSRLVEDFSARLDGRQVDVVFDPQGTEQLQFDLANLAPSGRVIIFGNAGGGGLDDLPALGQLIRGNAAVGGFSLAALSQTRPRLIADTVGSVLTRLNDGSARIDLTVLDGLVDVPAAQQALATGQGDTKYVVRVS